MKGSLYNRLKNNNRELEGLQMSRNDKAKRLLITISVVGSTGPLRFVANEDDLVCEVIHTALKSYARQARLPLLGFDATNFLLYCNNAEEADGCLSPMERIGSKQARNFVLCKRQATPLPLHDQKMKKLMAIKESHGWKAWINKSLSFKILSH